MSRMTDYLSPLEKAELQNATKAKAHAKARLELMKLRESYASGGAGSQTDSSEVYLMEPPPKQQYMAPPSHYHPQQYQSNPELDRLRQEQNDMKNMMKQMQKEREQYMQNSYAPPHQFEQPKQQEQPKMDFKQPVQNMMPPTQIQPPYQQPQMQQPVQNMMPPSQQEQLKYFQEMQRLQKENMERMAKQKAEHQQQNFQRNLPTANQLGMGNANMAPLPPAPSHAKIHVKGTKMRF